MNKIKDEEEYDILYAIGDTHGENLAIAPTLLGSDTKLKKCVLHCGDFGIGFSTFTGDRELMRKLDTRMRRYNIMLYAIRGNHDNPVYFNDPHYRLQLTNVVLVPDHSTLELIIGGNKKLVYLNGGAISVDRALRTPSKSYWWNEGMNALSTTQLDEIPVGLDIVITHTRPSGVFPINKNNIKSWLDRDMTLNKDLNNELNIITDLFQELNWKNEKYQHFYGHFHMSNTEFIDGNIHKLLNIKEICEIK